MNKTDIFAMIIGMLWDAFWHMMHDPFEQGITGLAIVMPVTVFLILLILRLLHHPNKILDIAIVIFLVTCVVSEAGVLLYALRDSEFAWNNPAHAYLARTLLTGSVLFLLVGIVTANLLSFGKNGIK